MGIFDKLFGSKKANSESSSSIEKKVVNEATLTFKYKGEVHEISYFGPNDSILDSILNAGFDIPFSCQGGTCGTCNCKLNQGEVIEGDMEALNASERKKGYTLACASKPASAHVMVDFDDYVL